VQLAHDVSFQLSGTAGTAGIAAMTDGIAGRLGWLPAILRDPFAATIAAEAATWPLWLANFHQLSIVAPAANALVLPLLPAIMVLGGGGALLAGGLAAANWPGMQSVSSFVAWPLMQASGAIASWLRLVIEAAGSLPPACPRAPCSRRCKARPCTGLTASASSNSLRRTARFVGRDSRQIGVFGH
jgi:competence protein ComEC